MVTRVFTVLLIASVVLMPLPAVAASSGLPSPQQDESPTSGEDPLPTNPADTQAAGLEPAQQLETMSSNATAGPVAPESPAATVWITETVFVTEVVPVEVIVPVTETIVITEVIPVEQTVLVTETITITEVVPVEQVVLVTETVTLTEVVPVEVIVPVTETALITEVVPVEEVVLVTETVTLTEVVPVEVIVPVTETVLVTETVYITNTVALTGAPAGPATPGVTEPSPAAQATPQPAPQVTPTPPISATAPISATQALTVSQRAGATPTSWTQLSPSYYDTTPLPVSGLAMYYAPNVMENVAQYRLRVNNIEGCEECVGSVALLRAGDLDRKVWIQQEGGEVEGPFQVLDVAARHHIPSLLARNWVVDVDYDTAMRWGMRGPVPVTILGEPPTEPADELASAAAAAYP